MRARGPGQSVLLLLDVAAVLANQEVEYAVIGAMAASVHGSIRATTDADALVSVSAAEARAARKERSRKPVSTPTCAAAMRMTRYRLCSQSQTSTAIAWICWQVFADSTPRPSPARSPCLFSAVPFAVIGREDFIAMKCFAGGPQDIADARNAIRAADEPINVDLLRRLTRRFVRPAADVLEHVLTPPFLMLSDGSSECLRLIWPLLQPARVRAIHLRSMSLAPLARAAAWAMRAGCGTSASI